MSATLGGILSTARTHLRAAPDLVRADRRSATGSIARVLERTVRLLQLYTAQYGTLPLDGTSRLPAPASPSQPLLTANLERARRHLHTAATAASGGAAEPYIAQAALLLRAGLDLLATHHTGDGAARTATGHDVLADPAIRARLLEHIAALAAQAGRIAATTADIAAPGPGRRALSNAADALQAHAEQGEPPELPDLHPATSPRIPTPPRTGESTLQATDEIRAGLERLRAIAFSALYNHRADWQLDPPPAAALRTSALALAIAHEHAADLLEHLNGRANATTDAGHLHTAAQAWGEIAAAWTPLTSLPDAGTRHPYTAEARALSTRFGRLGAHDPSWRPSHGRPHLRAAEQIAPDAPTSRAIAHAIDHLAKAAPLLARDHARIVARDLPLLLSTNQHYRPEGEHRRYYPITPAERFALTSLYQTAAGQAPRPSATSRTSVHAIAAMRHPAALSDRHGATAAPARRR